MPITLQDITDNINKIRNAPSTVSGPFLGIAFDKFVAPRFKNLSPQDLEKAKEMWTSSILGKSKPLPSNFGESGPSGPTNIQPQIAKDFTGRALQSKALEPFAYGASESLGNIAATIHDKTSANYWRQFGMKLGGPGKGKAAFVERNIPGLEMADILGAVAGKAPLTGVAKHALTGAVSGLPFTQSLKGAVGMGLVGGALGKLFGGKAAEVVGPSSEAEEAVGTTIKPVEGSTTEETKDQILDRLGAPQGTTKEKEDWLYFKQRDPSKIQEYETTKTNTGELSRKVTKKLKYSPKVVKEGVEGLGLEEKSRVVNEARKLTQLYKGAGATKVSLTPEEIAAIRSGKSAEQVFNPITPEVVAEQPQTAAVEGAVPRPAELVPKAPKEDKLPQLGVDLRIRATKQELKEEQWNVIGKRLNEDAKELAKNVIDGTDSEDVKRMKLSKIYNQQKKLQTKISSGMVTASKGAVDKSLAQNVRRTESRQAAVSEQKEAERLSRSSKSAEDEFLLRWGRKPNDAEQLLLDTGSSPGEAVDPEYQEQFEEKGVK